MNNNVVHYGFHYRVNGRDDVTDQFAIEDAMTRDLTYDDSITWDAILRDFIDFLSGIYGYDIGDQVKFRSLSQKIQELEEEYDWSFDEEYTDDEGEEAPKV